MTRGQKNNNGIKLGLKQTLWVADKERGHMNAAEYKHVLLGLIFLKYISEAFSTLYGILANQLYADLKDSDEYAAENIFQVPKEALGLTICCIPSQLSEIICKIPKPTFMF